jgi:hypothetical protein
VQASSARPIVGAFAAGLVGEDVHLKEGAADGSARFDLVNGLAGTGRRADRSSDHRQAGVCSGCSHARVNRLAVGIGMIPRGEVGLIFASVGAGLMLDGVPVIGPSSFSAEVLIVVTILVTPPALKWSLR